MTNIKAVLLDFDGTIVNTLPGVTDGVNYVLKMYNKDPVSMGKVKEYYSFGREILLAKAMGFNLNNKQMLSQACKLFKEYYHSQNKNYIYKDVLETLELLKKRDIKVGIISNNRLSTVKIICKSMSIAHLFDIILAETDTEEIKLKPEPDSILYALEYLDVIPNKAIYVGDSKSDMIAASRAGVYSIGAVYGGIEHPLDVIEENPDFIIYSFNQIADIILK